MQAITLDEKQQKLRDEIKKELEKIKKDMWTVSDIQNSIKDLGKKAHQLHISLKEAGNEPRHHKYMYENRRVSPEIPEFYEHIHPIEDLLKFIDDPTANDDPVDQTIGEEFKFSVYSKRWGHKNYKIKRTKDGWDINYLGIGGVSDKSGYPYLFKNLEQDSIEYPSSLGNRMKWLWNKTKEEGLTKKQVQEALNKLANWISDLEKNEPVEKVWQGF